MYLFFHIYSCHFLSSIEQDKSSHHFLLEEWGGQRNLVIGCQSTWSRSRWKTDWGCVSRQERFYLRSKGQRSWARWAGLPGDDITLKRRLWSCRCQRAEPPGRCCDLLVPDWSETGGRSPCCRQDSQTSRSLPVSLPVLLPDTWPVTHSRVCVLGSALYFY